MKSSRRHFDPGPSWPGRIRARLYCVHGKWKSKQTLLPLKFRRIGPRKYTRTGFGYSVKFLENYKWEAK